ncbi:MAG: M24 family metallopeptidase, partial [Akkermansiaceae bacterium]|nr:M24 family metallopeptidase [Akkermansiaceae bacterium]
DTDHDTRLPFMSHGTGHGIGLEVHEPILLDHGGGEIFENELFPVEPGLYSSTLGGCRVEDMVLVTTSGYENLTPIYEGLDWKDCASDWPNNAKLIEPSVMGSKFLCGQGLDPSALRDR